MIYLTRLSLFKRPVTLLAALLLIAAGVFSLTRLQREFLPDIDFPIVFVSAAYPGASTEAVLADLTLPLESAFDGIEEVDSLRSTSAPGRSLLIAEFEFGLDMAALQAEVEEKVALLQLPDGVPAPTVQRLNPDVFPLLQISLLGELSVEELAALAETVVVPALSGADGVGSVNVIGARGGISRTNGEPSITLSILKHPDANTVETSHAVRDRMAELELEGAELAVISDLAPAVEESLNGLAREGALGAVFAVAMIFLFLANVRATFVISVSIPLSVLAALLIMERTGLTLNLLTMGGLAIAIGRVVDDSIVVLENVYRHIQRGESLREAALSGTSEVATAITASTLTTIAVFVPLTFVTGFLGEIFVPFAYAVTFALVASLVVALTVVPALSSLVITRKSAGEERETWLQRLYTPVLRWALGHRVVTVSLAFLASVLVPVLLVPLIPVGFFPSAAEKILTIDATLPRGSDLRATLGEIERIEAVLAESPEVKVYLATSGGSIGAFGPGTFGGGSRTNRASFFVRLGEDSDPERVVELLEPELVAAAPPGVTVLVEELRGGGPETSNNLTLRVSGEDQPSVALSVERIIQALESPDLADSLTNLDTDMVMGPIGAAVVTRIDGRRAATVSGIITASDVGAVSRRVQEKLDAVELEPGVQIATGGVFLQITEGFREMLQAVGIAILLVYVVMVVSLRSLLNPFIIILSLPLASVGAVIALAITQRTLGMPALLGILMLVGLVVTNAIVLITFVQQLRDRGMSVHDSLLEGGRLRVRPIVMTAGTTILVLFPLSLGLTQGGLIGAELATVVIGGLFTSTVLTLVVVPVVYSLFASLRGGRAAPVPAGVSGDEGD